VNGFVPHIATEIDLVLVGDDVSIFLQPRRSGKHIPQKPKTRPTTNGVNQSWRRSKSWCANEARNIAFRGLSRFSGSSRMCGDNPPKCSMIAPVVVARLAFEKWKQHQ